MFYIQPEDLRTGFAQRSIRDEETPLLPVLRRHLNGESLARQFVDEFSRRLVVDGSGKIEAWHANC